VLRDSIAEKAKESPTLMYTTTHTIHYLFQYNVYYYYILLLL
jgi:hypothetical protein